HLTHTSHTHTSLSTSHTHTLSHTSHTRHSVPHTHAHIHLITHSTTHTHTHTHKHTTQHNPSGQLKSRQVIYALPPIYIFQVPVGKKNEPLARFRGRKA